MHITNIQYPYKDSWDVNQNYVTFELEGVDNTYANALRRIILSDLKSVGFKTRPYDESDVSIVKNETTMDNQKLSHRIGLVPINIEYPEAFDVNDYQFYINKSNTSNEVIEVTSQDFKIKKLSKNEDLSSKEVKAFFPPNPITHEYMFICYLLPDKTGSGNAGGQLQFTAKASVRTARTDAKYNIAQTSFVNKQDPVTSNKAWKDYYESVKNTAAESKAILEKRFQTTDAKRYFHTDEYGHPNKFEFFIESYTVIKPLILLYKAIDILGHKLNNFNQNLKSGNYNEVDVYPSETDMNAFDILIHNETYTLASLLQSYTLKYFGEMKDIVTYIGHTKPHPLKNTILLRIALKEVQNNKENVIKVIDKCVEHLIKINSTFKKEVAKISIVSKYLNNNEPALEINSQKIDKELLTNDLDSDIE